MTAVASVKDFVSSFMLTELFKGAQESRHGKRVARAGGRRQGRWSIVRGSGPR